MTQLGRTLVIFGVILVLFGLTFTFSDRLPFRFPRLPLDIRIQKDNYSLYIPLGVSIFLSVVISLVLMAVNRR